MNLLVIKVSFLPPLNAMRFNMKNSAVTPLTMDTYNRPSPITYLSENQHIYQLFHVKYITITLYCSEGKGYRIQLCKLFLKSSVTIRGSGTYRDIMCLAVSLYIFHKRTLFLAAPKYRADEYVYRYDMFHDQLLLQYCLSQNYF